MKKSLAAIAVAAGLAFTSACGADPEADEPDTAAEETTTDEQTAEDDTPTDGDTAADEEDTTDAEESETGDTDDEEPSEDEPAGADGSREAPYAVGDEFTLGDWTVTIVDADVDATDAIMSENEFNDPPADGRQFVMFGVEATYNGEDTGTAWLDLGFQILGSEGNTFGTGMEDMCGVIPDDLMNEGEAFPGATVSGNSCVSVPSEQIDGALLIAEPSFSFDDERVFVSLDG